MFGGCLLGTCLAAGSLQDRQDDERANPPQQEEQVEQPEGNARIEQQEDARQERCAAQRRPRELLVLPPPLRGGQAQKASREELYALFALREGGDRAYAEDKSARTCLITTITEEYRRHKLAGTV